MEAALRNLCASSTPAAGSGGMAQGAGPFGHVGAAASAVSPEGQHSEAAASDRHLSPQCRTCQYLKM